MNILITNHRLHIPDGSRSFVRDLGRNLERLGHSVVAYSSARGGSEELLEEDMVRTTSDMERLPFRPDVIHAQHHLDAMTAILALPGVPALYHCHGAVMLDCVPKHPRIHHYLAMSRTLAERMMVESNIAPRDITVFLNGVDLARFCHTRTPPELPARALVYQRSRWNTEDTVTAIREAAVRTGILLDCIGQRFGRTINDPEHVLPTYDIVFASGISAIEALACGCAVVILGRTSCGEMVTPENFDRFRQVNFSIAVNSPPPRADKIEAELRRFSAEDCARVSEWARRELDFGLSIRKLVGIYEQVIQRHKATEPDPRAEILATSRYLRKIAPLVKMTDDVLGKNSSSETGAGSFDQLGSQSALVEKEIKK